MHLGQSLSVTLVQVEAKYPALLFKQQLDAFVQKIFPMLRDNVKKEITPQLAACIHAPRTATTRNRRTRDLTTALSGEGPNTPGLPLYLDKSALPSLPSPSPAAPPFSEPLPWPAPSPASVSPPGLGRGRSPLSTVPALLAPFIPHDTAYVTAHCTYPCC